MDTYAKFGDIEEVQMWFKENLGLSDSDIEDMNWELDPNAVVGPVPKYPPKWQQYYLFSSGYSTVILEVWQDGVPTNH